MAQPSISMPDEMDKEVDTRCETYEPKSHYTRVALEARFMLEDAGEWSDIVDRLESTDEQPPLPDGGQP